MKLFIRNTILTLDRTSSLHDLDSTRDDVLPIPKVVLLDSLPLPGNPRPFEM